MGSDSHVRPFHFQCVGNSVGRAAQVECRERCGIPLVARLSARLGARVSGTAKSCAENQPSERRTGFHDRSVSRCSSTSRSMEVRAFWPAIRAATHPFVRVLGPEPPTARKRPRQFDLVARVTSNAKRSLRLARRWSWTEALRRSWRSSGRGGPPGHSRSRTSPSRGSSVPATPAAGRWRRPSKSTRHIRCMLLLRRSVLETIRCGRTMRGSHKGSACSSILAKRRALASALA